MSRQYCYSNKTANYSRVCRLLIDVGTFVLRDVFDETVPPGQLSQFLKDNRSKLKKVGSLTKWHMDKLFPADGSATSASFDLSILYILLRTVCNIQTPCKGWGRMPDTSDTSKGAYIERLRQFRNDIGHANSAEMENDLFEEKWKQIQDVLLFLGGSEFAGQIRKLYDSPLEPHKDQFYVDRLKTESYSDKKAWDFADNLKNQCERIIEARRKDDAVFVETRAYRHAEKELFAQGRVQIIGDPGEGKTFIAWHLILQGVSLGYELVIVHNAKEWQTHWNPGRKQIFLVDDCFGVSHPLPNLAFGWDKLQQDLRECIRADDTLVVSTVRRHIYKGIKKLGLKLDLFGRVIDLCSEYVNLTTEERSEIIRQHATHSTVDLDVTTQRLIAEDPSPRFPLSCRLFISEPRFQKQGAIFFKNPTYQLHRELSQLFIEDKVAFSALVLLMVNDGRVSVNQPQLTEEQKPHGYEICCKLLARCCRRQASDERSFASLCKAVIQCCKPPAGTSPEEMLVSLHRLTNTYVILDEASGCYRFVHHSVLETVGLIVGSHDPNFVLSYCSSHFIQQRVRAEWRNGEFSIDDGIVPIPFACYQTLAERFIRDIERGNCDAVFQNPSVHVPTFVGVFASCVGNLDGYAASELANSKDGSGHSMMYWVARADCSDLLQFLMSKGLHTVDAIDGACFRESLECAKLLIQHGSNVCVPRDNGLTPLHIICSNQTHSGKSREIVQCLLQAGADLNHTHRCLGTPLHMACWNQHEDMVSALLDSGANPNTSLLSGWPSLHFSNNAEIIRKWLVSGHNKQVLTSNTHWSALHLAVSLGNTGIADRLIQHGANVDAQTSSGWTPLMCAVKKGHIEMTRLLLTNGADKDMVDDFRVSALHISVMYRLDNLTTELVQFGANCNIQSAAGYSPLHCACETGNAVIVRLLLQHGAEMELKGVNDLTPVDVARRKGKEDLLMIFHNR